MTNGMTMLVTGNLLLGVLVIVLLLWDAFGPQREESQEEECPPRGCGRNGVGVFQSTNVKKTRCG